MVLMRTLNRALLRTLFRSFERIKQLAKAVRQRQSHHAPRFAQILPDQVDRFRSARALRGSPILSLLPPPALSGNLGCRIMFRQLTHAAFCEVVVRMFPPRIQNIVRRDLRLKFVSLS